MYLSDTIYPARAWESAYKMQLYSCNILCKTCKRSARILGLIISKNKKYSKTVYFVVSYKKLEYGERVSSVNKLYVLIENNIWKETEPIVTALHA